MENTESPKPPGGVPASITANPRELAVMGAYLTERKKKAARPVVKVTTQGKEVSIWPDHPNPTVAHVLLARAMGSTDQAFTHSMLLQMANASGTGPVPDEATLNFLLSVIEGVAPRDQTEAMLAAQMAVVHNTMMTFARRLNHVESIPQQDSAERTLNKLARTFAVQMETLKRYRTGGEQKVTVQHVHVNDGGQAIVGTVAPIPLEGGGAGNAAPSS